MLRIGIIGCGFIARQKHVPSLRAFPTRCEIAALCDVDLARAERLQDLYELDDAYLTEEYEKLLADDSIDAVHVCTPNNIHCEVTCAALAAGKHVMCEKPMAITGEEARAMVAAAEASGRKLTVSFQNRFRRDVRFLREAAEEGRLGEIYVGRAEAVRRRGVPTWGVFTDKKQQGGGPLIDLGGHSLDLTLWLMNDYEVDFVVGTTYDKLRGAPAGNDGGPWDPSTLSVEDSAFGFVRMRSGATVTVDAAWALNVPSTREALTTLSGTLGGGELCCDDEGLYSARLNGVAGGELFRTEAAAKTTYWGTIGSPTSPGGGEAKSWLDAIEGDTDPVVLPTQACRVTEILEGLYRSAESGVPIFYADLA